MPDDLRLAGRGRLATGETIVWTIADGRRGRRWRELLSIDGRLVRSLLLECEAGAAIGRLEMTTETGLLTVHPSEDEATLHGNVVTAAGIRHLSFDWSPEHGLAVDRSPALATALAGRLGGGLAIGDRRRLDVVGIDDDLNPNATVVEITRTGPSSWLVMPAPGHPGPVDRLTLDGRGVPVLTAGTDWPLET